MHLHNMSKCWFWCWCFMGSWILDSSPALVSGWSLSSSSSSSSSSLSSGAAVFTRRIRSSESMHTLGRRRFSQLNMVAVVTTPTTIAGDNDDNDANDAVGLLTKAGQTSVRVAGSTTTLPAWRAKLIKAAMLLYIAGMCILLPATLVPQQWLYRCGLLTRTQKEYYALRTAQACARWMLRFVPFCHLDVIPADQDHEHDDEPAVPSIWVCNHTSMLDVFVLLAADKRLRRTKRRPIKIVYWKQLEANPVSRLLFRQAGFIPVDMSANGNGNPNEYNKATFKQLLKDCKQAFEEGFDIGILPEGQLNPTPEQGLMPVFPGAYTLAKMSRRPIQMMAMHGAHRMWHADESIGMTVTDNHVTVRCYPSPPADRMMQSADEFKETFKAVVGHFGTTGRDLPAEELEGWLSGTTWARRLAEQQEQERLHKEKQQQQQQQQRLEQEHEHVPLEAAASAATLVTLPETLPSDNTAATGVDIMSLSSSACDPATAVAELPTLQPAPLEGDV